ncbi:Bug family tripartite tricarboxylate transporter substrate binding protein [Variovorax sp. PAMC 28711]|uniref:Bug family tripartite tricarboxylate transporter substrate binding protein n=1 Tax=Variovorax sp. PAMC 28711 TaxID=1795631 RepID=UPI00078EE6D7|nr:tripartite tricarboxylate transporter substrate binding protein [Variovorax sp. PAMC 28711]AMM23229.1 hypothetical protein AX767_01685 [Variovorax sp. PAMC 28711]
MKTSRTTIALCSLAMTTAAWLGIAPAAHAQKFPTQPIKLIVGASPGGTTDALARELAEDMSKSLGQPVIIDNKPGAGGNIAADFVARAPADGHTLLVAFTSHTMNAALFKKLPYDPVKDFTPISLIGKVASVLVARPDLPAKDLKELLAAAKQKDGYSFAIGGTGSSLQMDTAEFRSTSKLPGVDIPYKGSSPALVDVMSGQVDLMFAPIGGARTLLDSGKVKAYAVTSAKRLASMPDVPAVSEVVPSFTTNYGWFGVLGPARLPAEVTARLNEVVVKAIQSPRIKTRLAVDGSAPSGTTPTEFRDFLIGDVKQWAEQAKLAKIEPQ